jgi:hypothetical protein
MKLLLILPILFYATPAHADTYSPKDIPPGEDVIVAVKKGAPAPFDGQIFDINTSLRWANWLVQYREHQEIEAARTKSLCNTELAYYQELADVEIMRLDGLNQDLMGRLKKSEQARLQLKYELDNPPWYESNLFFFALGAVTVGTFGILAAQTF